MNHARALTELPQRKRHGKRRADRIAIGARVRRDHEALAAATRGLIPLYEVSRDRLHATKVPVLAIIGDQDTFNLEPVKRMAAQSCSSVRRSAPGQQPATGKPLSPPDR